MRKQLFGYTPTQREDERYVPFLVAAATDEDNIAVSVRSSDGEINEIALPRAIAAELGVALVAHAAQTRSESGPAAIHAERVTR